MNAHPSPTRRDPDATRQAILEAAFEEIHAQGFRNASLDNILARAGVTKGALYHHFPNKTALGYAVIDEIIWPMSQRQWALLADESVNPIDALIAFVREELQERFCHGGDCYGCPINNLVQEMSTVDEGFRQRLVHIQTAWRAAIAGALRRGQRQGSVRRDIDPEQTATLLVAGYEGCNSLAKAAQQHEVFEECMQGLIALGESLRAR